MRYLYTCSRREAEHILHTGEIACELHTVAHISRRPDLPVPDGHANCDDDNCDLCWSLHGIYAEALEGPLFAPLGVAYAIEFETDVPAEDRGGHFSFTVPGVVIPVRNVRMLHESEFAHRFIPAYL